MPHNPNLPPVSQPDIVETTIYSEEQWRMACLPDKPLNGRDFQDRERAMRCLLTTKDGTKIKALLAPSCFNRGQQSLGRILFGPELGEDLREFFDGEDKAGYKLKGDVLDSNCHWSIEKGIIFHSENTYKGFVFVGFSDSYYQSLPRVAVELQKSFQATFPGFKLEPIAIKAGE